MFHKFLKRIVGIVSGFRSFFQGISLDAASIGNFCKSIYIAWPSIDRDEGEGFLRNNGIGSNCLLRMYISRQAF